MQSFSFKLSELSHKKFATFRNLFAFVILSYFMISCSTEVDFSLPEQERKLTLNCIINPDNDTINAQITYSRLITDVNSFESVEEISISFFEEGELTGYFSQIDSTHFYFAYQVKPGKKYRIEASTGKKTVWAETQVPINFETSFFSIKDYAESFDYIISIIRNQSEESVYWISAKGFSWYNGKPFYDIAPAIYSDCSFADDFNRLVEQGYGYMYIYEYYIRLIGEEVPTDTISVQFHPAGIHIIDGSQEVFVLSVDYHLDKYMKSSILLEEIDMYAEDVPIVYAPFPMYSNINGGTGIFGSYNSVSEKFQGK
jgi:hypothetical protein